MRDMGRPTGHHYNHTRKRAGITKLDTTGPCDCVNTEDSRQNVKCYIVSGQGSPPPLLLISLFVFAMCPLTHISDAHVLRQYDNMKEPALNFKHEITEQQRDEAIMADEQDVSENRQTRDSNYGDVMGHVVQDINMNMGNARDLVEGQAQGQVEEPELLVQDELDVEEYMPVLELQSVTLGEYRHKMSQMDSYRDLFRIFYGDKLADDDIDSLLSLYPRQMLYGMQLNTPDDHDLLQQPEPQLEEDLISMLKHVDEVDREGQCARPVPVVLPTNTFFREANKILAPDCTIVYQCRNDSGCCNASSVCAPKTTTNITRLFMVMTLTPGKDRQMVAPAGLARLSFSNHTDCECRPLKIWKQCRSCPQPFQLLPEQGTDCVCECPENNRTCLKMWRGTKPLPQEQLTCIKDERCERPRCKYGEFTDVDLANGYCPEETKDTTTEEPTTVHPSGQGPVS